MKQFSGRVAVVTGAASGLGRELALAAARLGMKTVLADIDEPQLEETERIVAAIGSQTASMTCDVSDAGQVEALAGLAMSRFGGVHLLFNNAGVGCGGFIWENSEADWQWVLGVNLWGVIHGVRIFTPLMLEAAKKDSTYEGHIVNTSSMAGIVNAPALGPYNVSKHAVVSLSETLHHDLMYTGAPVGASVLCPYYVATGIGESGRNRPEALREASMPTAARTVADTLTTNALAVAKLTAAEVAVMTFDAVRDGCFYIFPHPAALPAAGERMRDIVEQREPGNPYRGMPEVMEMLRKAAGN